MLPRMLVLAMVMLWQCFGASPIATISSTQPVMVSGITVPTNRVMSWPVTVNDEIATQNAPATLRFPDGSVVKLQRNTRMRLQPGPSGVEVKMLAGSAIYDLKSSSRISVGTPIPANPVPATRARAVPRAEEAIVTALAHRTPSTAPNSGIVFAPSMFGTAAFAPSVTRQASPAGARNIITLPNGLVLFVNPITSGGVITGYTIIGVGADTLNGSVVPTPGVTTLDGYTITVSNGSAGADQIRVFAPGSANPLTGSQASTLIQTTLTNVNKALPPSQQIVSTTPGITIQAFSLSAP